MILVLRLGLLLQETSELKLRIFSRKPIAKAKEFHRTQPKPQLCLQALMKVETSKPPTGSVSVTRTELVLTRVPPEQLSFIRRHPTRVFRGACITLRLCT